MASRVYDLVGSSEVLRSCVISTPPADPTSCNSKHLSGDPDPER